ncbi:hypothetical protein EASAB2608_04269 [Streptomyces sp. EAS-AB2608]|nr:hypothetical protein EASAB2608_04269 [Streptomyces sp. EAS-AB2608]
MAGSGDARGRPAENCRQATGHTNKRRNPPAPLPGTGAALTPVLTERRAPRPLRPAGPFVMPAARDPYRHARTYAHARKTHAPPRPDTRLTLPAAAPASPCSGPASCRPRPGTSTGHPECDSPHRKFPDGRSNPSRFSLIKPARSRKR